MTEHMFTTGEASGLTKLSVHTVQRYINAYPQAFTDRAKIKSRGRRYTGRDIKMLFVIHELKKQPRKRGEIAQLLAGDIEAETKDLFEIDTLMKVASEARREITLVKYYANKAQEAARIINLDGANMRKKILDIERTLEDQDQKMIAIKNFVESLVNEIDRGKTGERKFNRWLQWSVIKKLFGE